LPDDIHRATHNDIRADSLGEYRAKRINGEIYGLGRRIHDVHRHAAIINGNLQTEGRRVLSVRNVLISDLVRRHAQDTAVIETVANRLLATLLSEPLGTVFRGSLDKLLLNIQKEVVELGHFIIISRTSLRIRVTTLERPDEGIRYITGLLVLPLKEAARERHTREAQLEVLIIIL
jgi:hypothetical protein